MNTQELIDYYKKLSEYIEKLEKKKEEIASTLDESEGSDNNA